MTTAVAMVAASQHTDNPKELKDGVRETHDNVLKEQRRLDALAADLALHATSARADWRKTRGRSTPVALRLRGFGEPASVRGWPRSMTED